MSIQQIISTCELLKNGSKYTINKSAIKKLTTSNNTVRKNFAFGVLAIIDLYNAIGIQLIKNKIF